MVAQGKQWDIIVVGAGLAGLVATYEAQKAGKRVLVVDQENCNNRGGQAFWSLGGMFLIDSPEQRRMGIRDSFELARRDWFNSARFDGDQDSNPRKWAEAYLRFAAGEKRDYLRGLGMGFVPVVGWAERGGASGSAHGNSVPRFHLTWGTGPEVVRVFIEPVEEAEKEGRVEFAHRCQVDEVLLEDGAVVGVRGTRLVECPDLERGKESPRETAGSFEFRAPKVMIATGGVGGNLEAVRRYWPEEELGPMPEDVVTGVPAHVDGRGIDVAAEAGASIINRSRMWHYTEGMKNWDPIWPNHGIRIIPGPSSLWFTAEGDRLRPTLIPGADTIATMKEILATGHSYSWFVLDEQTVAKEFLFSGSEQNPDLTDKEVRKLVDKVRSGIPEPVRQFMDNGEDWVVADTLEKLVAGMNDIAAASDPDNPTLDVEHLRTQIEDRDSQTDNAYSKDYQVNYTHVTRKFLGDKLIRSVPPHKLLDNDKNGPLIAIRLRILTRKTLGGIETNLDGQVIGTDGEPVDGLWAGGEATGFGGGGVHGHNALEGTFLGGCVFSGLRAGRSMAR